ncbi:MAG: GNAT family N-acetyltransferase [Clostridia bacterium]|nr:GNAT family N-acetyltransferase [Clostridia bacterium]
MEIRKLNADDYEQLLDVLDTVFANFHKHPMDFRSELPKMCIKDDKHMGYHTGVFEDGKLVAVGGVYPLPVKIGDASLLFSTTGNMATLPEYEGRGYFNKIFTEMMKELKENGFDGARLGGLRQRYSRFGYEPAGLAYSVSFTANNRIKYFKDAGQDITFREIKREDTEILAFCDELSRKSDFYVERSSEDNYRDVYLGLRSKHATAYVALKDGAPIGYLAASGSEYVGHALNGACIWELRYTSIEHFIPMICAWQRRVNKNISFKLAPYMQDELRLIIPGAEGVSISSPSRFKILNYDKVADALMKLKLSKQPLMKGELIIGIEDYGNIRLYVDENTAGCEKTDKSPEFTLDKLTATRVLFGHMPVYASIPVLDPLISDWLPLPLCWCTLDYV